MMATQAGGNGTHRTTNPLDGRIQISFTGGRGLDDNTFMSVFNVHDTVFRFVGIPTTDLGVIIAALAVKYNDHKRNGGGHTIKDLSDTMKKFFSNLAVVNECAC